MNPSFNRQLEYDNMSISSKTAHIADKSLDSMHEMFENKDSA
jgi:hypothetical protein